jgi:hypothetical protein
VERRTTMESWACDEKSKMKASRHLKQRDTGVVANAQPLDVLE